MSVLRCNYVSPPNGSLFRSRIMLNKTEVRDALLGDAVVRSSIFVRYMSLTLQ